MPSAHSMTPPAGVTAAEMHAITTRTRRPRVDPFAPAPDAVKDQKIRELEAEVGRLRANEQGINKKLRETEAALAQAQQDLAGAESRIAEFAASANRGRQRGKQGQGGPTPGASTVQVVTVPANPPVSTDPQAGATETAKPAEQTPVTTAATAPSNQDDEETAQPPPKE